MSNDSNSDENKERKGVQQAQTFDHTAQILIFTSLMSLLCCLVMLSTLCPLESLKRETKAMENKNVSGTRLQMCFLTPWSEPFWHGSLWVLFESALSDKPCKIRLAVNVSEQLLFHHINLCHFFQNNVSFFDLWTFFSSIKATLQLHYNHISNFNF